MISSSAMRRAALLAVVAVLLIEGSPRARSTLEQTSQPAVPVYAGLDRNNYPGDSALASLHKTFAFTSYWLNTPPGEKAGTNTWNGTRERINAAGFGFVVLFNSRPLPGRSKDMSAANGKDDGAQAATAAQSEGFPAGTVIFLDVEEGGRMLPPQLAYIFSWVDSVTSLGFRAGIYCSGIPAHEEGGVTIVTANDIRDHAEGRNIAYWVYNDACPPSPGCAVPGVLPTPAASGVQFADIWQYAQSPRTKNRTARCAATYNRDGNCYAPGGIAPGVFIDMNVASSADPSHGRR